MEQTRPGRHAGESSACAVQHEPSVMLAIRDWLRRGEGTGRVVRLELDGDKLELLQASAADQERLIELFASRHSAGNGSPWPASEKR